MITLILLILSLIAIGFLGYYLFKCKTSGNNCNSGSSSTILSSSIPSSSSLSKDAERGEDALTQIALAATKSSFESGAPKTNTVLQNAGIDDVLVISLDNSPRWNAYTLKNIESGGFKRNDYRRWRAVNGKTLSKDTIDQLTTPNRQYKIGCEQAQQSGNKDLSQFSYGAVGCALSHWSTWYHVANDPSVRAALVFEDDVTFKLPNAPEVIAHLVQEAGGVENFDFLRLDPYPSARDHQMCFNVAPWTQNLLRELGLTYNFTGYVVTKRGAQKLLKRALPIYEHIDHHPSYLAKIYPYDFLALLVPRDRSFVRQNRQIPSTIRTK